MQTNEIHAKPLKITIGFPIGTGMGSSRPKKLGAMNNFGNRFQIDWQVFPRGCELLTRHLKDCSIDFPWFFVEIINFEGQIFEFSAKCSENCTNH